MKIYSNVPRLKTSEKTGARHVLVKKNTYRSYRQHWHDYFEIEVVLSGAGVHTFNGTEYAIGLGDAYLLSPVDFHMLRSDGALEIINVSFDTTWLSEEMQAFLYSPACVKRRRFDEDELRDFVSASDLIKGEYERGGPCIRQLLEYLIGRFSPSGVADELADGGNGHPDGIMRAVAYARQHFRERITLAQLSRIAGYHPAYFSSLFCKVTGETYTEFLAALRISYAQTLLKCGFTVSEACFASGFGSLSNFSSIFKKRCGMSPTAYRSSDLNSP